MTATTTHQRILTGTQSTGTPHLGNMVGAMIPALQLAKKTPHSAFFFIANLHALTTQKKTEKNTYFTHTTAATWLALGLDTQKDLLYRQSMIPEVCELAWYLNCCTPYPMLANAHAFKAKSSDLAQVNAGLFTYPILMAADILLYNATHVPVGADQQQHLEITRDVALTFNNIYAPLFVLPQPLFQPQTKTILGIDGRKMSKSYGNTLNVFAPEEEITQTIMRIQTDNKSLDEPKDPDGCTIFQLYQAIANKEDTQHMKQRYLAGGLGYKTAKKELLHLTLTSFKEQRKAFNHYLHSPETPLILQKNEQKVRAIAQQKLQEVRKILGTA